MERKPVLFDPDYAIQLKSHFPELWDSAGGTYGNHAFKVLMEIVDQGGYAITPEQLDVLDLRDAWFDRHKDDKTTVGILAQVKWLSVGSMGEASMKRAIGKETEVIHIKRARLKDPKGGLTAAGRKFFKRTEGANLKPGVKGAADTPEKMRRKGSFLTRFFTNPSGPMKDENGKPTRLALSAAAWGEPVPQNAQDAAALAAKGRRMLDRYHSSQKKQDSEEGLDTKEKAFWDKPIDGHGHSLTDEQKKKAEDRARRAGRKYPNLVDNAWAAQQ